MDTWCLTPPPPKKLLKQAIETISSFLIENIPKQGQFPAFLWYLKRWKTTVICRLNCSWFFSCFYLQRSNKSHKPCSRFNHLVANNWLLMTPGSCVQRQWASMKTSSLSCFLQGKCSRLQTSTSSSSSSSCSTRRSPLIGCWTTSSGSKSAILKKMRWALWLLCGYGAISMWRTGDN